MGKFRSFHSNFAFPASHKTQKTVELKRKHKITIQPSKQLKTNGPRSRSASLNLIGPHNSPPHIKTQPSQPIFSHIPRYSKKLTHAFSSLSNLLRFPKVSLSHFLQWPEEANLSPQAPPRRARLGAAKPVFSSPSAVSPVSSKPASTPNASAVALLSTSPPSSSISPPRSVYSFFTVTNSVTFVSFKSRKLFLCYRFLKTFCAVNFSIF